MTYLKTALITSAMTLAASSAAFAGNNPETKMSVMENTPMAMATVTPTAANDTIGEILQADGLPTTNNDRDILTYDGDLLTTSKARMLDGDKMIKNNAIVVPGSDGTLTTVNCPAGTVAKIDMTCHATGEFEPAVEIKASTDIEGHNAFGDEVSVDK